MAAEINNTCEIYEQKGSENLLLSFSIIVPSSCKANRFVFCFLNTGVVGWNSTRGVEVCRPFFSVRVVPCKYRPPDIPIISHKTPIYTTFRNMGEEKP
jgi:hypothetical protein